MGRFSTIRRAATLALVLGAAAATTLASADRQRPLTCDDSWGGDSRASHCEVREQELGALSGALSIAPGMNGGVAVHGWDKSGVLVRARVTARAATEGEAKAIADQVVLHIGGGEVRAAGPELGDDVSWDVSFQVFVPHNASVSARTFNGGIAFSDINGTVRFEALNGGVSLDRLGGSVVGSTTNGGIAVRLAGDRWDGEMLDVRTTNGGVSMKVPANYSARLEVATSHGGFDVDASIATLERRQKTLSTDIGGGGALVRATTVNGGVSIRRGN
jgi:hypothetical protein